MTKIELEIHDDVLRVLNKIKGINDQGVELVIPEGSVLFDNIINLKLIDQQAENMGVSVQFSTEDEAGSTLISVLEGNSESTFQSDDVEENIEDEAGLRAMLGKKTLSLPKINLKMPSINFSNKPKKLFFLLPLALLLIVYIIYGTKAPKADAKITLASNPLTRSLTVKVKLDTPTSQTSSLLKGTSVETTIQTNGEAETTGEKLVGEKAEGTVIIYNKTLSEITLKKGTKLTYEKDNKDYEFSLDSETSIPAGSENTVTNTTDWGKEEADVTATDIGNEYNIDEGKTLSISKYKSDSLTAKAKDDFKGGKADKVKIVSELDRTNLAKKLQDEALTGIDIALKSKLTSPNKLISGAVLVTVTKEAFSHAVGVETDKLALEQTLSIKGLTYSDTELNSLLSKLIVEKTPEGYTISKNDWSVKAEALGNSTSSVLSATEADLQVTLKTAVVPIVDKDEIKKSIAGKQAGEAEKVLGSVKNVKSYELKVSPVIPFFNKVPKDLNRIELLIENE